MVISTSSQCTPTVPETDESLRVGPSAYSRGGYIRFGRYRSGEIALEVVDETGEPEYTATVSLVPYRGPHAGENALWLKGWSENEGVPAALVTAGIVRLTGRRFAVGFSEAEHAQLTERAQAVLAAKRDGLTACVHREIDELVKLAVIGASQAEHLKRLLTAEVIEQHDQDGMSIREMVDLYRDLTEPARRS